MKKLITLIIALGLVLPTIAQQTPGNKQTEAITIEGAK